MTSYSSKTEALQIFTLQFRILGTGSPVTWAPHSHDLTPPDFFIWVYVRHAVYVPTMPTTVLELPWRKQAATSTVTSTTLKNMWTDLEYTHITCQDTQNAPTVKCKLLSVGHISYII